MISNASAPNLPGFAYPGPLRERLSGLVLAGAKAATFDLYDLARLDRANYPAEGRKWTMHDSLSRPLAILMTTEVRAIPMAEVTAAMADAEGESFQSVNHWRTAHEQYWGSQLDDIRAEVGDPTWCVNENTVLVYEEFTLMERLPAADEGRYPVVELVVSVDEAEMAAADLYELDTVGVEEVLTLSVGNINHVHLRAGFASDEAAVEAERTLWRDHPSWNPRFEVILGDDWLDAWREHFTELTIGRLRVIPDWDGAQPSAPAGGSALTLRMDPKRAWGTGGHPSTQLVLNAMQSAGASPVGGSVLDVGCGSGILALASVLLGARTAHGIDVDRAAIAVTLENAGRNGLADRVTAAWLPVQQCTRAYDLVLANILAPVLIELADEMQRVTQAGGTIVVAGLVEDQVDRVIGAFDRCRVVEITSNGGWRCIVMALHREQDVT